MVDRVKWVIAHYNLTAAQFADKIGVQRSAVSHVLSGRNNPSLDFLLKIIKNFPALNLNWLALGSGQPLLSTGENLAGAEALGNIQHKSPGIESLNNQSELPSKSPESSDRPIVSSPKSGVFPENEMFKVKEKKLLSRVILLYADGSFETYESNK